jgi:hypothetical protein
LLTAWFALQGAVLEVHGVERDAGGREEGASLDLWSKEKRGRGSRRGEGEKAASHGNN